MSNSNEDSYNVVVNETQYNTAVHKCKVLLKNIVTKLHNYRHRQLLDIIYNNSYYFKILRKDTLNGFQICVSPITGQIEQYLIHDNKKVSLPIKMNNYMDIIHFILNNLLIDFEAKQKLTDISNLMNNNFPNFTIQLNTYTISMFENSTQNGYYIYFDFDSYAKIGYIRNNRYYKTDSKVVESLDTVISLLNEMINCKVHNHIRFYNIVHPKFVDCEQETNVSINTDQESNLNVSYEDDPV